MTKLKQHNATLENAVSELFDQGRGLPSVGIVNVTPEIAQLWIENAASVGFNNRNPSLPIIQRYANEMFEGRWVEGTYDPIHLAIDGSKVFPINGQHRLKAVIASQVPTNFLIVCGVDRSVFKYYDQGRQRDLMQIITIANTESGGKKWVAPRDQATMARLLYKEDSTGNPTVRPNADDQDQDGVIFDKTVENYNGALDDVFKEYGTRIKKIQAGERVPGQVKGSGLGPCGVWAYFLLRATKTGNFGRINELIDYASAPSQNANPNVVWKTLLCYIAEIRALSESDDTGRVMKGRHKEFSDNVTAALFVAWNLVASGERVPPIVTMSAFNKSGSQTKWFANFNQLVSKQLASDDWGLIP
jgi:hypothetical protein